MKFDTGNFLQKVHGTCFAFFENHDIKAFFSKFTDSTIEHDLHGKVSLKYISANADSVAFKLVCNFHALAKMAFGIIQDCR